MTTINRRTALQGVGAALAAITLPTPTQSALAAPAPLSDVTTRLGLAMDEVSALLGEWSNGQFRAIIAADRNYSLQNCHLAVPATIERQIEAWLDEHDKLMDITRRLRVTTSQQAIDHLSSIRSRMARNEEEARNAMLRALLRDRRA